MVAIAGIEMQAIDLWFESAYPVYVPILDTKCDILIRRRGKDPSPTSQQIDALANFFKLSQDSRERIVHRLALACHYTFLDDDTDPLFGKPRDHVWQLVRFRTLLIPNHGSTLDQYAFVLASCTWESEHGLELLFKNGELFQVTGENGLYLNSEWSSYFVNE